MSACQQQSSETTAAQTAGFVVMLILEGMLGVRRQSVALALQPSEQHVGRNTSAERRSIMSSAHRTFIASNGPIRRQRWYGACPLIECWAADEYGSSAHPLANMPISLRRRAGRYHSIGRANTLSLAYTCIPYHFKALWRKVESLLCHPR
jgi:hypothetical protein